MGKAVVRRRMDLMDGTPNNFDFGTAYRVSKRTWMRCRWLEILKCERERFMGGLLSLDTC